MKSVSLYMTFITQIPLTMKKKINSRVYLEDLWREVTDLTSPVADLQFQISSREAVQGNRGQHAAPRCTTRQRSEARDTMNGVGTFAAFESMS